MGTTFFESKSRAWLSFCHRARSLPLNHSTLPPLPIHFTLSGKLALTLSLTQHLELFSATMKSLMSSVVLVSSSASRAWPSKKNVNMTHRDSLTINVVIDERYEYAIQYFENTTSTMSKAFFKSSIAPELCYKTTKSKLRSIEVWLTSCIVTNFGKGADCSVLVNPGNSQLTGCSNFPYFPRGGPVPKEKPISMHKDWQPLGFVSQWGGMEVGSGMMYPVSVVDGLVHQYGGWKLQAECKLKRIMARGDNVCPVGSAVMTASGGLQDEYAAIVHTTPPFYKFHDEPEEFLSQCYQAAFKMASAKYSRVATPLLGAGARGFPEDVAIRIAAEESLRWCQDLEQAASDDDNNDQAIVFGLLDEQLVDDLITSLETNESTRAVQSN